MMDRYKEIFTSAMYKICVLCGQRSCSKCLNNAFPNIRAVYCLICSGIRPSSLCQHVQGPRHLYWRFLLQWIHCASYQGPNPGPREVRVFRVIARDKFLLITDPQLRRHLDSTESEPHFCFFRYLYFTRRSHLCPQSKWARTEFCSPFQQ